VKFIFSLD